MAVGNVQSIHLVKFSCDYLLVFRICNHPELMTEMINRSYEIINRSLFRCFLDQINQRPAALVSKENRLDVCVRIANVLHTVLFLITTRELVLFDYIIHVIIHVAAQYDTILCFTVHRLSIEIVILVIILH